MDGVIKKRAALVTVAVAMVIASPVALAGHDPAPEGDEEVLDALVRMGTDGYVVVAERTGNQAFSVHVLHGDGVGPGTDPVKLLPDSEFDNANTDEITVVSDATNQGVWLHGLNEPEIGERPVQSLTFTRDPSSGNQALQVEILPATEGIHSVVVIAPIVADNTTSWVGGFYHPVQSQVPLDILDAVPHPINFYP